MADTPKSVSVAVEVDEATVDKLVDRLTAAVRLGVVQTLRELADELEREE